MSCFLDRPPKRLLPLPACLGALCLWLALTLPAGAVPFQDWFKTSSGTDTAAAMAVDGQSNLLITGKSLVSGKYQGLTLKYSPSGALLWSRSSYFFDEYQPMGLAVDASGNVYVTGNLTANGNPPWAYATIKYLADGTPVTTGWPKIYSATAQGMVCQANAVAVNQSTGVVFVSGWLNTGTYNCYVSSAYHADGSDFWNPNDIGGVAGADGRPNAITVDPFNNFYVTGTYGSAGALEFYIIKHDALDPQGAYSWSKSEYGLLFPAHTNAIPKAIAVDDSNGSVYVTGTYNSPSDQHSGFITFKYRGTDGWGWGTGWPQAGDSNQDWLDEGADLVLDSQKDVIFVGTVDDWAHRKKICTIKYSAGGDIIWKKYYYPGYDVYGKHVAVDREDNVYVAGLQALLKYQANGDLAWATTLMFCDPVGLALGDKQAATGHVYVAGTQSFFSLHNYFGARFRQVNALPFLMLLY